MIGDILISNKSWLLLDCHKMKKSIWLLLILAPLLPEISTGSSSIESLFDPVHLVILLLGYGLAVLVIREFSIRRSLSYAGIYILGIAFGVFNEGFLAKVLIKESDLPITQYDGYGVWGGVNMGFTLAISLWHALFSVLIPILIVHRLKPETSTVPWLSKRATLFSGVLLVVLGYLSLFGSHIVQGNITQALILSAIMLLCFVVGARFKKKEKEGELLPAGNFSWRPVWLGTSLFVSYFIILTYLLILAGLTYPLYRQTSSYERIKQSSDNRKEIIAKDKINS